MIAISCPTDDAEAVFRESAARTRNPELRSALLALSERISERATEYLCYSACNIDPLSRGIGVQN